MNIDYNAISVTVAVVSSLIAIFSIAHETRRSNLALGLDLLFKINDQFNQPDFAKKRKTAAKFLLRLKDKSNYDSWTSSELDDILDFFQTMASLTERKVLDKVIVWEYYSYWLKNYYLASREYIELCQEEDQFTWEGVIDLYKLFIKMDKRYYKKSKQKSLEPSLEEIKLFLTDESKLHIATKKL